MHSLFTPLKLGSTEIKNKIIMAPLTRARATNSRIPNSLMKDYYTQRSEAGMILTEATAISADAVGYADTPGIWNDEQIKGWKEITEAVHAHDSKIFMQLWHVGRISHSSFLEGNKPVAPSALKPAGHVSLIRPITEYETPRALETSEIKDLIKTYKQAAINAKTAGFDGVELHAANGYLIDQFLQDSTNHRVDEYGGNIENRAKLLLEVTDVLIEVWGADKVGMHLAPRCDSHDMGDSDPLALFSYVVEELEKRKLAFIFTREALKEDSISPKLKTKFSGVFIVNEAYTKESAIEAIDSGRADAVAFGKDFIASPDLVTRFKENAPLNKQNPESFYGPDEKGYTDYPFLNEEK